MQPSSVFSANVAAHYGPIPLPLQRHAPITHWLISWQVYSNGVSLSLPVIQRWVVARHRHAAKPCHSPCVEHTLEEELKHYYLFGLYNITHSPWRKL